MSAPESRPLRIGVLAVQGDFEAHARALERLGAEALEVRGPEQLEGLDGFVIPGGESTTIGKGIVSYGLLEPLRELPERDVPIFGTCAGLITLARATSEPAEQPLLGLLDLEARRNAFGRQLHSFEADLEVQGLGDEPLRAVFIRAPWVEHAGAAVEVLAELDGHPVAVREGLLLACAFHPELTDDLRMHALFLAMASEARERRTSTPAHAEGEAG